MVFLVYTPIINLVVCYNSRLCVHSYSNNIFLRKSFFFFFHRKSERNRKAKKNIQNFPRSRINQFHFSLTSLSPNMVIMLLRTDMSGSWKRMTEETLGGALLNTIFRTLSNLTMALTHTLKYLIQMHCATGDIIHLHFSSKELRLRRIKKTSQDSLLSTWCFHLLYCPLLTPDD